MMVVIALAWLVLQAAQPSSAPALPQSVCGQAPTAGSDVAELCVAEQQARAAERLPKQDPQRTHQLETAADRVRRVASLATRANTKVRAIDLLSQLYDAQHLNQPSQEEGALRDLIRFQPGDLAPVSRLARLQETIGLIDAAEDTLLAAHRQQPDEVEPYRLLAQFYSRRAVAVRKVTETQQQPATPGEADENRVYRVGGSIAPPTRIDVAQYPPEARAAGISGVVILEIVIDESGNVSDAKVLRSVPLLDEAALRAVRNWRFTPTMVNGQAVKVTMTVTQNFTTTR